MVLVYVTNSITYYVITLRTAIVGFFGYVYLVRLGFMFLSYYLKILVVFNVDLRVFIKWEYTD